MSAHLGQCRPHAGMAPCAPSSLRRECRACARHAPQMPADPEARPHTVLIDASTLATGARCAMWVRG